jgi:hypothetical protein
MALLRQGLTSVVLGITLSAIGWNAAWAVDCGVQGKAKIFDRLAARGKARINYRGGLG